MRRLLLLVVLVGCASSKNDLADPTTPFHAITVYGDGWVGPIVAGTVAVLTALAGLTARSRSPRYNT